MFFNITKKDSYLFSYLNSLCVNYGHLFNDLQLNKMKDYYDVASKPNKVRKIELEENFKVTI